MRVSPGGKVTGSNLFNEVQIDALMQIMQIIKRESLCISIIEISMHVSTASARGSAYEDQASGDRAISKMKVAREAIG